MLANLTFVFEVAFIGDDYNREGVLIFDSKDLLMENTDFFERVSGGDGVYEEEAFASAHVLLSHGPVKCQ